LEKLIKSKNEPARPALVNSDSTNSGAEAGGEKLLYLTGDDGEMLKVAKDRFLIGRGKHCDLVINSGKVSREHAAVVREGADFFIEDLGSSNGTWFNKQRIKRRKVEEGDEYFICSEKVRCTYR
jgi:pSer/pThr/pTyr-binding forkhead associated (FHA) protein